MSKNIELDDAIFRLEMLTETFIALEEATEHSENELPKHFLYFPVYLLFSLHFWNHS